jgi:hypothetical protein
MPRASREVTIEWSEREVRRFSREPNGDLALQLFRKLAEVVLAGAKRRALVRTGDMRNDMEYRIGTDDVGLYADVISPVQNPKTGFPYALMHERRKPKDRRPHRSLAPALNDIRKILTK